MLTAQEYNDVLQFVQALPTKSSGFPRDLLYLFETSFRVSVALMILYQSDGGRPNKSAVKYNYIVRNLNPNQVKPYFDGYFKFDVFRSVKKQLDRTVASITDLLSKEERKTSPYYQYLNSIGIAYQTCIFLRDGKNLLATVSLFRSAEEGDFTPKELELFAAIEPFITKQYLQMVKNNELMSLPHHFNEYFSDLNMGVALLDNNGRILKANKTFNDFSQYIYEHGSIEDSFVTQDTVDISSSDTWGQKLLNYFGSKVISRPERIKIECLLYQFKIYTQAIYSQSRSNINMIEYLYLTFLVRQEKVRSAEMLDALKLLTPREMTLLGYLASGLSNAEIADKMVISPFTVKTHLQNIYSKCHVSGRNELLSKLK